MLFVFLPLNEGNTDYTHFTHSLSGDRLASSSSATVDKLLFAQLEKYFIS